VPPRRYPHTSSTGLNFFKPLASFLLALPDQICIGIEPDAFAIVLRRAPSVAFLLERRATAEIGQRPVGTDLNHAVER